MSDSTDVHEVRGHLCDGLRRFFAERTVKRVPCIPDISPAGIIEGCDDEHPLPITHCPYCGQELA